MMSESEKNSVEVGTTSNDLGMALLLSGLQSPGALTTLFAGGQDFMLTWESNLMPSKVSSE